jgi:GrpB-like predicted nucleotidyltransferase (UPF0157 family)
MRWFTGPVPFPDEPFLDRVEVIPYQPRWADEGADLVAWLRELVPSATAVDHIGSTAVPGLCAKDCLDAMVRVTSLAEAKLTPLLDAGFRERPEEWNREEVLAGVAYPKCVFAPPIDGRPVNVHVRETGSPVARYALLFRDYLRADPDSRDSWGRFKTRLAQTGANIYVYGQIKSTIQPLLMTLAERWAVDSGWHA